MYNHNPHTEHSVMADDDAEVPAKKARTQAAQPLQLGGRALCAIGLGCLPAGVAYPQPARRPDAKAFQAIVQAAASAASPETLFVDTADTYCEPCNNTGELEHLLRGAGANVVVSTKAGMVRSRACLYMQTALHETHSLRPCDRSASIASRRVGVQSR